MSDNLKNSIQRELDRIHLETVTHYKRLHRRPELSFQEKETAAYVESVLKTLNIPYRSGIGGYGILAWLEGKEPDSQTIALRADMDALPIAEDNDIDFKSENPGVMHACGHDAHTASLLSALKIINNLKERIIGTVLFVFQPGEERHPGGASLMLADGIFDRYKPDVIVGQHAYVDYPVGTVGFQGGVIMASADEIHLKISGKGGHGAIPHAINDTVLAAAQVVVAMQQVVSRRANPFKPAVLTVGKFIANGATNIIPDEVVLAGTLRCMDENERKRLKPIIHEIAVNTAKAYGCKCKIDVYDGYPCTYNNEEATGLLKNFAVEYLGEAHVKGLSPRMTSEDFGFFSQQYPAVFYRFGIQGKQCSAGLHTSRFLIDEEALRTSAGLFAYIALRWGERS
ncbi:MAG: amidohydrolase [Prevotella sp.]|jgi:hippurate hydrolase|nr:amidohydrolase [Prevotella sp.]